MNNKPTDLYVWRWSLYRETLQAHRSLTHRSAHGNDGVE
jgi:hypothetical protein